jgi:hypothetical protein
MLNLIQKFISKDHSNKSQIRKNFLAHFYSIPEHSWIINPQVKTHFDKLFSHLPANLLDQMMSKYLVIFVPSEQIKNQILHYQSCSSVVVIFPEFQNLLMSNKKSAVAYLAHELAFILLELEGFKDNKLMAEVEADKFVSDLGLTFELEELLLMLDETIEKRLRLTYLTAHHFKDL